MTEPAKTVLEALLAVQANLPKVSKTKTAKVKTKSGVDYSYSYADLETITDAVGPLLAFHDLVWTCLPDMDNGLFVLRYKLAHVGGTELTGCYPIGTGTAQELGSAISYGRRYCLTAVLGLVTADDDDDAMSASGRDGSTSRRRATRASTNARISAPDGPITDPQVKALHTLMSKFGLADRESRLTFVNGWIGREVASSKDLTAAEAGQLIDHLSAEVNGAKS